MRRLGAICVMTAIFSFAIFLCARLVALGWLLATRAPHAITLSGGPAVIGFSVGAGLILAVIRDKGWGKRAS